MTTLSLNEFYGQSLGLKTPWRVTKVVISAETKQVDVRVECASGVAWTDPETQERAEIKSWHERSWRHLDTCEFQTVITARVPRVLLKSGRTMMVQVPWSEAGGRITKSFEQHLIDLLTQCRTVRSAARMARVSEDVIDGVMKRAVERGLARREKLELLAAGLDEKAIRKGHRYVTILSNVENGSVIDIIEGRTKEATVELLTRLPRETLDNIEAVAMDMWPAYIGAVAEVLPEAAGVFDRFHIKAHLNKAVDQVRRQENRKLSAAGNPVLRGTKFEWLKKHEDLRLRAATEFRALLLQDLQTGTAWALKENFDHLWNYTSLGWAMRFIDGWLEVVKATELKPLCKVGEMIKKHMDGILNYLRHPITNATAEGLNSIIQSLKHAARGLPNFESFRTRVMFFLAKLDLTPA